MLERSPRGNIRRAADYFKLIRYSFSGGGKSFAGRPCDIRRFFYLIWECSRRLANVVIENKDFEELIDQYDRENAFFTVILPIMRRRTAMRWSFQNKITSGSTMCF